MSPFIEVLTLVNDHLISAFDLQHLAETYPLNSKESSKDVLFFHTLHFVIEIM